MRKSRMFPEFFRQSRNAGIFLAIFSLLISAGYTVMQYGWDSKEYSFDSFPKAAILLDCTQIIAVLVFAWAVVGTFAMHRQFNQKQNADFYLSLPISRPSMMLQYLANVLVWAVIYLLAGALAGSLTLRLVTRGAVPLLTASIVPDLLGVLAGACFLMAAFAIGVAVGGHALNVFLTGVSVAVGPRLALYSLKYFPAAHNFPLDAPSADSFLSPRMNTMFDIMLVLNSDGYDIASHSALLSRNPSWTAILWTFFAAAVYLGIALLLVRRRRGEMGGTKAGVHAATFGMVFGANLFTLKSIYERLHDSSGLDYDWFGSYWREAIVFFLGSAVLFFFYEWLFQKKWSKALRSFWVFGLAILLDALLLGAVIGVTNVKLSFAPAADDIEAVAITSQHIEPYDMQDQDVYSRYLLGDWSVNDKEVNALIADALAKPDSEVDRLMSDVDYVPLEVRVKTNGRSRYRAVCLTQKEYETLMSLLSRHEETWKPLRQFPTGNDILGLAFSNESIMGSVGYDPSEAEKKQLAELVARDWRNLSTKQLLNRSALVDPSYDEEEVVSLEPPYTLYLLVQKKGNPFLLGISIDTAMKESYAYISDIYRDASHRGSKHLLKTLNGNQKSLLEDLETDTASLNLEVDLVTKDTDTGRIGYSFGGLTDEFENTGIQPKKLAAFLEGLEVLDRVPTKDHMPSYITVNYYRVGPETDEMATVYGASYILPKNEVPSFLEPYIETELLSSEYHVGSYPDDPELVSIS